MGGSSNGTVKQCKVKEQSIYRPINAICDTPFVTYIYCYMFRHIGAILREWKKSYTINITIYVPFHPIRCWYAINGVSNSACVGWYIDCQNMHSVNNRKLQNGWINMWTEGTVAVRKEFNTGITDVPAISLIYKHKCSSCVDACDCQEVLRIPSVAATQDFMPHSVGCVTRGDASDCHKVQVFILVPQQYKTSHQD